MLHAGKVRVPLPPDFFQCSPLSSHDAHAFVQQAMACADHVVDLAMEDRTASNDWVLLWDQSDFSIYRGPDQGSTHVSVASTEVAGTLDEVAALFHTGTTRGAKELVGRLGRHWLDAAVLHNLDDHLVNSTIPNRSGHSDELQHVFLTWTAMQSPWKQLGSVRDACLLECHKAFQYRGKRGFVRATQSIELMSCPPLRGFVRVADAGSGLVFVESDRPGHIRAFVVHQLDFSGRGGGGDWAVDLALQRWSRGLLDLDTMLREDRLSASPFAAMAQLHRKDKAHKCALCTSAFGWFGSAATKTHCMKCGMLFCKRCIQVWSVMSGGVRAKVWACTKCAMTAPAAAELRAPGLYSPHAIIYMEDATLVSEDDRSFDHLSNKSSSQGRRHRLGGSLSLREDLSSKNQASPSNMSATSSIQIMSVAAESEDVDDMSNYSESVFGGVDRGRGASTNNTYRDTRYKADTNLRLHTPHKSVNANRYRNNYKP